MHELVYQRESLIKLLSYKDDQLPLSKLTLEFSVRPIEFEFILTVLVTTSFYGVGLLAPHPTPNLEEQGFFCQGAPSLSHRFWLFRGAGCSWPHAPLGVQGFEKERKKRKTRAHHRLKLQRQRSSTRSDRKHI